MIPKLIKQYLQKLGSGYHPTEHSHRPALIDLLEGIITDAEATNEPSRMECGAPDLVMDRNKIPFGYLETKNIGVNLDSAEHQEQLQRYCESLDNLIFTNYLEFRLFRRNKSVQQVRIGELRDEKIEPLRENFTAFVDLINNFSDYEGGTIASADELANRMAYKTRMLANVIGQAILKDHQQKNSKPENLTAQYYGFRKLLIHDINSEQFADIYAQTIAYGMFAARLHTPTQQAFTRRHAADLIPESNPFLPQFF